MHELALAHGILSVVLDVAEEQPVRRVRLRVGALQRVVPDSLQFSFQLLADDTPAFTSRLEIKTVQARVRCRVCGAKSRLKSALFSCTRCGSAEVEVLTGDELLVDAIELDSGWRYRPKRTETAVSLDHLREHAYYDPEPAGSPWFP